MLQDEFYGSQPLSVAAVMRVANPPVKLSHIRILILKHLTVKKLPITPATPNTSPTETACGPVIGVSRQFVGGERGRSSTGGGGTNEAAEADCAGADQD
jgi:hypothetical protein